MEDQMMVIEIHVQIVILEEDPHHLKAVDTPEVEVKIENTTIHLIHAQNHLLHLVHDHVPGHDLAMDAIKRKNNLEY